MKELKRKLKSILQAKRGETLVEGVVSLLLLTILLGSVTVMIQTSLVMTGSLNAEAEKRQAAYNEAAQGNFASSEDGSIRFTIPSLSIDVGHDIVINDEEGILAFVPAVGP